MFEVGHLEHDPNILGDGQTLSVGQSEELVHVEDRVQVLHPLGVDVSVKDDPLPLVKLTPDIVNDTR